MESMRLARLPCRRSRGPPVGDKQDHRSFRCQAVRCNGNVTIGSGAYIGSGVTSRQGIAIGAGAVVGIGAVVVKDVPANETVVGNPARILDKLGGLAEF